MAVIDARARIVCNLGPVISGSISDSHIQGGGIIYTTGSLELAGLFSHPPGTQVKLAFATNNRLSAAPRTNMVVLSCLANPLTRRTQIELGCPLSYAKNRGVGTVPWNVIARAVGSIIYSRPPRTIGASLYLNNLFTLAGFGNVTSRWVNTQDRYLLDDQVDLPSGYLGKAEDILKTYNLFAYAEGSRVNVDYLPVGGRSSYSSAAVSTDQIIDLNLLSGGDEPAIQAVGVAIKKKVTPQPEAVEQTPLAAVPATPQEQQGLATRTAPQVVEKKNTWKKATVQTSSLVKLYKDEVYDLEIPCSEKVVSQEITQAPDNRVTERVVQKITTLGKAATAVIQDLLDAGIARDLRANPNSTQQSVVAYNVEQAFRNSQLEVDSFTMEKLTYEKIKQKVPPNAEVDPDSLFKYRLRKKTIYEFVSRAVVFSRMPARNHALFAQPQVPAILDIEGLAADVNPDDAGEFSLIAAIVNAFDQEAPAQLTLPEGTVVQTTTSLYTDRIIDRIEEVEYKYSDKFVKELKTVFVPIGQTQAGQYQLSKALKQARQQQAEDGTRYAIDAQPYIDMYQPLVVDDFNMVFRSVDDDKEQPPAYDQNFEVDQETVYGQVQQDTGTGNQASTKNYEVPAPPDDIPTDDGGVEESKAELVAAEHARAQNALSLAHRFGVQLTVPINVLPTKPLSGISLNIDGVSGVYITNGTSWAFDANSCLVSTDAGFMGVRT